MICRSLPTFLVNPAIPEWFIYCELNVHPYRKQIRDNEYFLKTFTQPTKLRIVLITMSSESWNLDCLLNNNVLILRHVGQLKKHSLLFLTLEAILIFGKVHMFSPAFFPFSRLPVSLTKRILPFLTRKKSPAFKKYLPEFSFEFIMSPRVQSGIYDRVTVQ